MTEITLSEARRAIHTNAQRVDKKQKKPLPYELQTTPTNRPSTAGRITKAYYPAAGKAAMWMYCGSEPPKGGTRGRYHVRVRRGKGSYVYRRYDDVVMALACKMWLRLNGWESILNDTMGDMK